MFNGKLSPEQFFALTPEQQAGLRDAEPKVVTALLNTGMTVPDIASLAKTTTLVEVRLEKFISALRAKLAESPRVSGQAAIEWLGGTEPVDSTVPIGFRGSLDMAAVLLKTRAPPTMTASTPEEMATARTIATAGPGLRFKFIKEKGVCPAKKNIQCSKARLGRPG